MASACAGYFHAFCCPAAQDSNTLETLVTCCLLSVCTGLLQTQPWGAFLILVFMCVCRCGTSSNCACSVQPDGLLEGILHCKSLANKGNVYSVPKVQVTFPLLEEVHTCLQHLIRNLVVVLSLSGLCNSTKCNFEACSPRLGSSSTLSLPPPCEMQGVTLGLCSKSTICGRHSESCSYQLMLE